MPARQSVVEFDLHGQKSSVALLAVDKAFYGLHSDNRLTPKQVNTFPTFVSHVRSANTKSNQAAATCAQAFSTMQSYDIGCSYSGGPDPWGVLTEAGLSFVTHSQSKWKKSKCTYLFFFFFWWASGRDKIGF